MIGWERRVLLRHYLEQGMTKTELAERFGISRQTIYRWIRSGELDRDLSAAGVHYSARAPVATKLDRRPGLRTPRASPHRAWPVMIG